MNQLPQVKWNLGAMLLVLWLWSCGANRDDEFMNVMVTEFGKVGEEKVQLFTLRNDNGMEMKVTDFGGIVTSIIVPDKDGNPLDILLGFDSLDGYLEEHPYFGALIGRFGNRIANGVFSLNGESYSLATNNGANHLHGGLKGFDKVIWDTQILQQPGKSGLTLTYVSPAGEEGYPGTLTTTVTYWLTHDNQWIIEYTATTDAPTILNLTQHAYFNLSRQDNILDHELQLLASRYLPVDSTLIPLGEPEPVVGTPFDFLDSHRVGERIDEAHTQIARGGGYDHCWVLDEPGENKVAELFSPASGVGMNVYTTQPAIQFYTGNFLDGTLEGKGKAYNKRAGLCLETQHYPDSPNRPEYPSVVLEPGETFTSTTTYEFFTR